MTISEKSAYLKGLMDGLNLNTETNEGKMIAAIVDLLGDVTRRLHDVEETTIAISDELDEMRRESRFPYLGQEDPMEKGKCYTLQYSSLENSMDRGAW